jgi:hypothetical protein
MTVSLSVPDMTGSDNVPDMEGLAIALGLGMAGPA